MQLTVTLKKLSSPTERFNHELVFEDLKDKIEARTGYRVRQVATGSTDRPAVRVRLDGQPATIDKTVLPNVKLRVQPDSTHSTLNCRVVFVGVEEALADRDITFRSVETREDGQGTHLALRFLLDGYGGDMEEFDDLGGSATDRPRGQGFLADAKRRKAIEDRAVQVAMDRYRQEYGADVEIRDTGASHPYDLELCPDGLTIRVEVKGTTGLGDTVILTRGEVDNANNQKTGDYRVDFVLVTNIAVTKEFGAYQADGGNVSVWEKGWMPGEHNMEPTQYRYSVPKK